MRKLLLFGFYILFTLTAAAQIQRGDRLISGGISGSDPFPIPAPAAGANFSYETNGPASAQFLARYGYALLDRLMVGAGVYGYFRFTEDSYTSLQLGPFARYYVLNHQNLKLFGGLGTSFGKDGNDFTAFSSLNLNAGLQMRLAPDVFLTPSIGYSIYQGTNYVGGGVDLEFRLRRSGEEEQPVGRLASGQIMLGAQSAGVGWPGSQESVLVTIFNASIMAGGHYFVADRFAVGVAVGNSYVRSERSDLSTTFRTIGLNLGVSARYYLNNERRILWFAESGAGRVFQWSRTVDPVNDFDYDWKENRTRASLGGGAQIFIRERVSLEVAPQLSIYNFSTEYVIAALNFGLRFTL